VVLKNSKFQFLEYRELKVNRKTKIRNRKIKIKINGIRETKIRNGKIKINRNRNRKIKIRIRIRGKIIF